MLQKTKDLCEFVSYFVISSHVGRDRKKILSFKVMIDFYVDAFSVVKYFVLVSAFTLVGLNWLPPEQVLHLEPSQPTFADPEPGHTKWQANRDSIAEH